MRIVIGLLVSFLVGAGCRYFGIPVPSPPVLPGALLVVAMTCGYVIAGDILVSKEPIEANRKPPAMERIANGELPQLP